MSEPPMSELHEHSPAHAVSRARASALGAALPSAEEMATTVLDRAGDLDHTTERLQRSEQDLVGEYERNAAMLARIGTGGQDLSGHGSAADGAVTIETDATNRMTDLHLDPRALRLGSIANLRRAILDAYTAATEDLAEQLTDAGLAEVDTEPVRALVDAMPEVAALLPEQAWDRLWTRGTS